MTKAAELAKMGEVLTNSQIGGRRNMVINGAMQVAQRGTSQTSEGYGSLDRFSLTLSGASATFSQETVTLGDSIVGDFINFARLNVTTGNNFCSIRQRVENVQSVPEGTATISFYAKGTNPSGGVCSLLSSQRFGTGGSSDVDLTTQTFTLTSSWQRFDFQLTIPSISGKTIGTGGTSLQFDIGQGSDTSTNAWQIDITGIQLEVGEQATPFEHRSFGEELALCQRYCVAISILESNGNIVLAGMSRGSTAKFFTMPLPVTMRSATPSITLTGETRLLNPEAHDYADATDTFTIGGVTPTLRYHGNMLSFHYNGTLTGVTDTGNADYNLQIVGASDHSFIIDSEL